MRSGNSLNKKKNQQENPSLEDQNVNLNQPLLVTTIANDVFLKIINDSPTLYERFNQHILRYNDKDMILRQYFVKAIPIMRSLSKLSIQKIALKLNTTLYMQNSLIVKRGDVARKIYIIKEGVV